MKLILALVLLLVILIEIETSSWSSNNKLRLPRFGQIDQQEQKIEKCGKRKRNIATRRCFRQCTQDSDCRGTKRRCLCDGECGLSCVRITQMCQKISEFPNGHVGYSPDNYFGSKLIYSCFLGYTLIGDSVRICEGDGWWSGQSPTCVKDIYCDNQPPSIDNSMPNIQLNDKFKFGTEVEYQCDVGYVPSGLYNKSVCQKDGQWSHMDLKCNKVNCGPPTDIQNGYIIATDYSYSSVIEYRCNEGYQLKNGNILRECLIDGIWSGTKPTCEVIDCGHPPYLHRMYPSYNTTSFNSEAIYHCISDHYEIDGHNRIKCTASGTWSEENINCKEKTCKVIAPENGHITKNSSKESNSYSIGSIIEFSCDENYYLVGTSKLTCLKTTQLNGHPPKCILETFCPLIASPVNSFVASTSKPTPFGYSIDTKIIINCLPNYDQNGSSVIRCESNGKWDREMPTCVERQSLKCKINDTTEIDNNESVSFYCQNTLMEAKCQNGSIDLSCEYTPKLASCSSPAKIQNGFIKIGSYQHGSKAFYKCFNGYSMRDASGEIQCENGNWTSNVPVCVRINCPHPGTLLNGKILYIGHHGEYNYQSYMISSASHTKQIKFLCNHGFTLVGLNGSTCLNGVWKPSLDSVRCVRDKYFNSDLANDVGLERTKIKRKRKIGQKMRKNAISRQ